MKRRHSVMTHTFSQVPKANVPRSTFNRSHGHKTTLNASELIPIYVDEALPGDTFKLRMTGFARMATPIFPIMDNLFMDTFFFAVPVRLLWDNWERFNGAQDNPGDSTDFVIPQISAPAGGWQSGSLADYFGWPLGVQFSASALWHRAYNLCYREWFRDQNLIDSPYFTKGDGPDDPANYPIRKRCKRHDYFTSCLPFPQKGPGVMIPLGGRADLVSASAETGTGGAKVPSGGQTYNPQNIGGVNVWTDQTGTGSTVGIYADLSTATAATINSLRQAFQIQKIYERDARGGTRYVEMLKSHFKVTSPDFRLQRPELLSTGSTPVNINPVAQTSPTGVTGSTTPQGNLAAFGTSVMHNHGFTASFTEHMVILGLMSIRADLTYQRGLARMFSRKTRFDFFWPALQAIGEQAVLNKEIYLQGTAADDEVFGYIPRYDDYRYKPSQITGKFRSTDPLSLDAWHLSQDFQNLPVLGQTFIEENVPMDRVVAVPTEPNFIFDSYFSMLSTRPMPTYAVPGLIDHF